MKFNPHKSKRPNKGSQEGRDQRSERNGRHSPRDRQSVRSDDHRSVRNDRGPSSHSSHRQVIGLHAAKEVTYVRPNKIVEIWLKEGADRDQELIYFIDFAKHNQIKLFTKPLGFLDKIAPSHQGVCVLVSETPSFDFSELAAESPEKSILLALDQVTDPHNTGAVLRTAWLMGAKALLVPENRSGHLTPAAMKVASGGAEHVPLEVVDNLAQTLAELKEKGYWVYGLSANAKSLQWDVKFSDKVVLVAGAEDKGLRSTTEKACDELISIPQTDSRASFNASVAMALALYEVSRQHQRP